MVQMKSEILSNQYRDEGNKYFSRKEFFKAILSYNKVKFKNLFFPFF